MCRTLRKAPLPPPHCVPVWKDYAKHQLMMSLFLFQRLSYEFHTFPELEKWSITFWSKGLCLTLDSKDRETYFKKIKQRTLRPLLMAHLTSPLLHCVPRITYQIKSNTEPCFRVCFGRNSNKDSWIENIRQQDWPALAMSWLWKRSETATHNIVYKDLCISALLKF